MNNEASSISGNPNGSNIRIPVNELRIEELLRLAAEKNASDLHLSVGLPPILRIDDELTCTEYESLSADDVKRLIYSILVTSQIETFEKTHELDFPYSIPDAARFRCNIYWERGNIAAAIRVIPSRVPSLEKLEMPPVLADLARKGRGLIILTGPIGSGKSTTIAAMIDRINQESAAHIITLEDPIKYMHAHKKSMVHQRELKSDTYSFTSALNGALREDPDVLFIGEMRDVESITTAITLAETDHMVFGTLYTRNTPQALYRIIDTFPPHQQERIVAQLSNAIEAVIAQQLIPKIGGGRRAIMEIMVATTGIRNLIRERKIHQLYPAMETGSDYGMQTMDEALVDAYKSGTITLEDAKSCTIDIEEFLRILGL